MECSDRGSLLELADLTRHSPPNVLTGLIYKSRFSNIVIFEIDLMTKSMAQIVRFSEHQSIAKLARVLFWCSMALTFLCEVAAITVMAAISSKRSAEALSMRA